MENTENGKKIYLKLLKETNQSPELRQRIISKIEEELKKTVITFFTSFHFPVMIEDQDAVMIEEVLQNTEINKNGLVIIINSPGGSGLAAERIINICNAYSGNNYSVIVPNMAKSAATMICFGGNEILMSETSELGPIDPQITLKEGDNLKRLSIHSILTSYKDLFAKAVDCKGRLEPYLQQLNRYDSRDIEEFKRANELSETIAIKYLKNGMMQSKTEEDIKKKISPFLSPETTKSHGRPIFMNEAKNCGLKITTIDLHSLLWQLIWELYLRTDHVLKTQCFKVVESKTEAFNQARH